MPPPRVVRHDGDDPYLVVAADKGTATFSDIANAHRGRVRLLARRRLRLGRLGRLRPQEDGHHRARRLGVGQAPLPQLGHDTQTQDFTVVGVGDMSGDVFGNGMLLSRHIRLLAAFDHRHIFIDPDPDAAASFAERERLFALPRSSWADYDKALISAGGGVWPRSAKSIPLSPQARAALGIDGDVKPMTPTELMHAILLAPVDLFYNGGIGTYVKASDREPCRRAATAPTTPSASTARQLRCKVVAEGGNLGCTQRGRIEFALRRRPDQHRRDRQLGRRRLLGPRGQHQDPAQRRGRRRRADRQAARQAAGRDDRRRGGAGACATTPSRTRCCGVAAARGADLLDEQGRYMRHLEPARPAEPRDRVPARRRRDRRAPAGAAHGLTAPELAVLLAYSKMELYDEVLASDVPEDPYIATTLERYFPAALRERSPRGTRSATR